MGAALPQLISADSFGALDGVDVLAFLTAPGEESEVRLVGDGPSADLAAAYGIDLPSLLNRLKATGAAGQVLTLTVPPLVGDDRWAHLPNRLMFIGVGPVTSGDDAPTPPSVTSAVRRAGGEFTRAVAPGVTAAVAGFESIPGDATTAFAEGVHLAAYRHPATGTKKRPEPIREVRLVGASPDAVRLGVRYAAATVTARTLAATPSNVKNPAWLAEQAEKAAKSVPGLKVKIFDEKWIHANGLGGLAAVGGGSVTPPRFVLMEYTPKGHDPGEIVVVGKGITYDTGGISIKPRAAMVPMKTDMTGAAVAIAAIVGAARAKAPASIVAVLPLAENAFGAASYRPSDVVTISGGTTVEIGNTDAEGRLVLADGMAWAREHYDPKLIVDVATLTGAASLGLGKTYAALYATTPSLAAAFVAAGAATDEPLWQMPLVEEYRDSLDSAVADLCHITGPGVSAGSITAALFLQHFVGEVPWVHLDIAGPARAAKTGGLFTEGATGFSARALLHFLTHDPLGAIN